MKPNYEQIGKRIREKRIYKRLSQSTLAELADTSPQYISLIETGKKKASLNVIFSIAFALDISVDYLLTGYSESKKGDPDGLLTGLTGYEKSVLLDVVTAAKHSLKDNRWMLFE